LSQLTLKYFAILFVPYFLLILFSLGALVSDIFLILPLFLFILFFTGNFAYFILKNRCLSNCYFQKDSFLFYIFTRKLYISILSILISVLFTSIFILQLLSFHDIDFFILFFDLILVLVLFNTLNKNQSFNQKIKPHIIKRIVATINAIFLTIVFIGFGLLQTAPEYIQNDLIQTIKIVSNKSYSSGEIFNYMITFSNQIEAFKWWSMLKISIENNHYYIKEIVWTFYLIGNYMFSFIFGLYLLEILYFFKNKLKL
jgi:hypothetical protein